MWRNGRKKVLGHNLCVQGDGGEPLMGHLNTRVATDLLPIKYMVYYKCMDEQRTYKYNLDKSFHSHTPAEYTSFKVFTQIVQTLWFNHVQFYEVFRSQQLSDSLI